MEKLLSKTEEKQIVTIANKEIKNFIHDWKKYPYRWESEADVHGELYVKIKSALCKKLSKSVRDRINTKFPCDGMVKEEEFNIIYCKPAIHIKKANYPDLVIYRPVNKNENNIGERKNDPMLWVCEIKYATEWSSELTDTAIKNDIKKLNKLIERTDETNADYACLLVLYRWMYKYTTKKRSKVGDRKKHIKWKSIKALKKDLDKKIRPYFEPKILCTPK